MIVGGVDVSVLTGLGDFEDCGCVALAGARARQKKDLLGGRSYVRTYRTTVRSRRSVVLCPLPHAPNYISTLGHRPTQSSKKGRVPQGRCVMSSANRAGQNRMAKAPERSGREKKKKKGGGGGGSDDDGLMLPAIPT
jgi:hypothetical protein